MKIDITMDQVKAYYALIKSHDDIHSSEPVIPGPLLVHYMIQSLELSPLKCNHSTFKKSVWVGEDITLDYHQTGNVIEYRITSGRKLKVTGTLELIGG